MFTLRTDRYWARNQRQDCVCGIWVEQLKRISYCLLPQDDVLLPLWKQFREPVMLRAAKANDPQSAQSSLPLNRGWADIQERKKKLRKFCDAVLFCPHNVTGMNQLISKKAFLYTLNVYNVGLQCPWPNLLGSQVQLERYNYFYFSPPYPPYVWRKTNYT